MIDSFNPSESYEQRRLVAWLRHKGLTAADFTAIPLGGLRDPKTAAVLSHEGANAGWPDLLFASMPPIALELKRKRVGRVSAEQAAVHVRLRAAGWTVLVCHGSEEAKSALLELPHFLALLARPGTGNHPAT